MTTWAITVRAPLSRISLNAELQTFARQLLARPPHRAGNVQSYELLAGPVVDEQPQTQRALLLLGVDSGTAAVLDRVVGELTDALDVSYSRDDLAVSGSELQSIEKVPASVP